MRMKKRLGFVIDGGLLKNRAVCQCRFIAILIEMWILVLFNFVASKKVECEKFFFEKLPLFLIVFDLPSHSGGGRGRGFDNRGITIHVLGELRHQA